MGDGADPAFVATPSSQQAVSTKGFNRGEGWNASCVRCVGSKFTCDEHYYAALAAATGTAKTLQAAECEASQSGLNEASPTPSPTRHQEGTEND